MIFGLVSLPLDLCFYCAFFLIFPSGLGTQTVACLSFMAVLALDVIYLSGVVPGLFSFLDVALDVR
jgi:hypothetical protein